MKNFEFNKLANYQYYIYKKVDNSDELIRIRLVGEDAKTRRLLEENGYIITFIGSNAIEYTLVDDTFKKIPY